MRTVWNESMSVLISSWNSLLLLLAGFLVAPVAGAGAGADAGAANGFLGAALDIGGYGELAFAFGFAAAAGAGAGTGAGDPKENPEVEVGAAAGEPKENPEVGLAAAGAGAFVEENGFLGAAFDIGG